MQTLSYYKNKSIVALVVCLSISLILMIFNVSFKSFNIRSVFFFVTYPIEHGVSAISGFFGNVFNGLARIRELEEELTLSRERLAKYQEKLLLYSRITEENERLKKLLGIRENISYETIYARIIFRDPTLQGDYFIIDKGSLDGIRNDMPVVSFDESENLFLVGKTVEVNLTASKLKLLTARNFYLGVSLKDSGYVGILSGNGAWNQNCVLDYIPREANPYIGQQLVTSGESDIFPYGLLVGTVVGIGRNVMEEFFQKLYIRPAYRYSTIKDVFILKWEPAAEANVLIESSYEQ